MIPFHEVADSAALPERVFVYRNLKFRDRVVWSVRDTKTGRVVLHTENISLKDAEFVVGQAGRERVIKEGRKNVHAGVRGCPTIARHNEQEPGQVTYNPYKYSTFVDRADETPVRTASLACLSSTGVGYWR